MRFGKLTRNIYLWANIRKTSQHFCSALVNWIFNWFFVKKRLKVHITEIWNILFSFSRSHKLVWNNILFWIRWWSDGWWYANERKVHWIKINGLSCIHPHSKIISIRPQIIQKNQKKEYFMFLGIRITFSISKIRRNHFWIYVLTVKPRLAQSTADSINPIITQHNEMRIPSDCYFMLYEVFHFEFQNMKVLIL